MYCKNCGSQIDDNAVICPHCGVPQTAAQKDETNTLAIVGFIFAFFVPIVGLICSILGLKRAGEYGGKGHGLALAGLIVSIVWMVIAVIVVIVEVAILTATLNAI